MSENRISPSFLSWLFQSAKMLFLSFVTIVGAVSGILAFCFKINSVDEAWKQGGNIIGTYWPWILIGLAVLLAVLIFVQRIWNSLQLLNAYYEDREVEFPWLVALWRVLLTGGCSFYNRRSTFQAARIFIELRFWRPTTTFADFRQFLRSYREAEARGGREKIRIEDQVRVENCFYFTSDERLEKMRKYFTSLSRFAKNDYPATDRFLIEADVKDGFVAPLHLVDGMLAQFEDSWNTVIKEFRHEVQFSSAERIFGKSRLRRLQLFTLDCWLQWGPSIPICGCDYWSHLNGMIALQYGYGDENNSLPLLPIIETNEDEFAYSNLLSAMKVATLAVPLQMKVRPVWVPPGGKDHASQAVRDGLNKLSKAQQMLGEATKDGSVLLDYVAVSDVSSGRGLGDTVAAAQTKLHDYYSAYVWAMFVLCWKQQGDAAVGGGHVMDLLRVAGGQPVFPCEGVHTVPSPFANVPQGMPWLGLFPFFVHGNIADDEIYASGKRQLVAKALACIESVLDEVVKVTPSGGGKSCELKLSDIVEFRYVCAVDHSGCNESSPKPAEVRKLASARPIHEYFQDQLAGAHGHLAGNLVVEPDLQKHWHPYWEDYAACHLPELINRFYKHCAEKSSASHSQS